MIELPSTATPEFESPIEQKLFLALADALPDEAHILGACGVSCANVPWEEIEPDNGVFVYPQAKCGPYRADFLIVLGYGGQRSAILVECDGHDYHERTKEQARHDRSRDRWFTTRHVPVLRYTGSEIHQDAETCVEQVRAMVFEKALILLNRNIKKEV